MDDDATIEAKTRNSAGRAVEPHITSFQAMGRLLLGKTRQSSVGTLSFHQVSSLRASDQPSTMPVDKNRCALLREGDLCSGWPRSSDTAVRICNPFHCRGNESGICLMISECFVCERKG